MSVAQWKDIWLNEGFATYAEWLWQEHTGGPPARTQADLTIDTLRKENDQVAVDDPGVPEMFGEAVYDRGAATLEALRLTVGDGTFFDILHAYVAKFAGANASTADFVAVAESVAQAEGKPSALQPLFDQWLGAGPVPDLP